MPRRRRWSAIIGGILIIAVGAAVTFSLLSGQRASPRVRNVPVSSAFNDGFEVLVFSGADQSVVESASLKSAHASVAVSESATYLVPESSIPAIEAKLLSRDSKLEVVRVSVHALSTGHQQVTLSYHYGLRTFSYTYAATAKSVTPLSSSARDLSGERISTYFGP